MGERGHLFVAEVVAARCLASLGAHAGLVELLGRGARGHVLVGFCQVALVGMAGGAGCLSALGVNAGSH